MAAFVNETAIVSYLNNKLKKNHIDKGRFIDGEVLNVNGEDKITEAIKTKLDINDPIKLIILQLRRQNFLELGCKVFLNDVDKMNEEEYIKSLKHVIIGKTKENGQTTYNVIGYIEQVKADTRNPRGASSSNVCEIFQLMDTKGTCALLPEIIKEIIFKCVSQHYNNKSMPMSIEKYYNPVHQDIVKEVTQEASADAAAAAAEFRTSDECNFKGLLRSNIKNNQGYDYCKITDQTLLDKIKGDANIKRTNELIKSRLDEKQKEDKEKEAEETVSEATVSDATVSDAIVKKREAQMIEEGNEMYMISLEVLKGSTYSSEQFFNKYLNNPALNVDAIFKAAKEKEEAAAEALADKALADKALADKALADKALADKALADQEAAKAVKEAKEAEEKEKFKTKIDQLKKLKERSTKGPSHRV